MHAAPTAIPAMAPTASPLCGDAVGVDVEAEAGIGGAEVVGFELKGVGVVDTPVSVEDPVLVDESVAGESVDERATV